MAEKILLRLQVWNPPAFGGQVLRAADCIPLAKGALHLLRLSYAGRMTISLMRPVVES